MYQTSSDRQGRGVLLAWRTNGKQSPSLSLDSKLEEGKGCVWWDTDATVEPLPPFPPLLTAVTSQQKRPLIPPWHKKKKEVGL